MRIRSIRTDRFVGIPLPSTVIKELGPVDELDLQISSDSLVIRLRKPREGWAAAAAAIHEAGEDRLEGWDAADGLSTVGPLN